MQQREPAQTWDKVGQQWHGCPICNLVPEEAPKVDGGPRRGMTLLHA